MPPPDRREKERRECVWLLSQIANSTRSNHVEAVRRFITRWYPPTASRMFLSLFFTLYFRLLKCFNEWKHHLGRKELHDTRLHTLSLVRSNRQWTNKKDTFVMESNKLQVNQEHKLCNKKRNEDVKAVNVLGFQRWRNWKDETVKLYD